MSVTTEPMLSMTPEAVAQLKTFLAEQGTPEHALRVFFGVTRSVMGCMHSNRLPGSNEAHCEQECSSAPHRRHLVSSATSPATTCPHCAQRTTSR